MKNLTFFRARMPRIGLPLLVLSALAMFAPSDMWAQITHGVEYPPAITVDSAVVLHGERIPDPYRWLEAIDRPEVAEWVGAQNKVSEPYLASLPGRGHFRMRITQLYDFSRMGIPFWMGGRWYYWKNTGLQKQNVWYSRATLDAPEELVIDPNDLWPDGSVALGIVSPSPDGRFLVYGQNEGGADWQTFVVRSLRSGEMTGDTIRWARFSGISWTHDGAGFFYAGYPEPAAGQHLMARLENHTLYYHRLGTPQSEDQKIYAVPDPKEWVRGRLDQAGRYLFLWVTRGSGGNSFSYIDLGDPLRPELEAPIVTVVEEPEHNFWPLGVAHGELYVQTDDGAPNSRIIAIPLANPDPEHWRTVIPEGEAALQWAALVAGRISTVTLRDAASEVWLYQLDGTPERLVPLPGLGSTTGLMGRFDRPELFYMYEGPLYPATTFMYDVETGDSHPYEPPPLLFERDQFLTERIFFESRDGTRVPMFVTRRRDSRLDGSNPTMLVAYGGFGVSMTPRYSPGVITWLEQGGVYAVACIRGGGEYGQGWHEAGRLENKQNGFDDFIAGAGYLVWEGYTSPEKLAINGGSNGGLLVGAVMTQRPELFAVAVPEVGLLDMLRYHEFTGGLYWADEYGLATDSAAFGWLRAYSPLHNIRQGVCYPATLILTADHDDRVVPSHSYKFAAALQAVQQEMSGCHRPVLLSVARLGGHGYLPLDLRIKQRADVWSFAAQHTGMRVQPTE